MSGRVFHGRRLRPPLAAGRGACRRLPAMVTRKCPRQPARHHAGLRGCAGGRRAGPWAGTGGCGVGDRACGGDTPPGQSRCPTRVGASDVGDRVGASDPMLLAGGSRSRELHLPYLSRGRAGSAGCRAPRTHFGILPSASCRPCVSLPRPQPGQPGQPGQLGICLSLSSSARPSRVPLPRANMCAA